MRGGGGGGVGSWRAGQEGGIPPSQRILNVSTKARTTGRGVMARLAGGELCVEEGVADEVEIEVEYKD